MLLYNIEKIGHSKLSRPQYCQAFIQFPNIQYCTEVWPVKSKNLLDGLSSRARDITDAVMTFALWKGRGGEEGDMGQHMS